ncbi:unnamed protein product, partial [Polarella glacialis]
FETLRLLRSLSGLYHERAGEVGTESPYEDTRTAVDLGSEAPPPLAFAYEYFDLNVEQAAGLWINGVAAQRLLRCPPHHHPISLHPESHANDWETEEQRMHLLWHNAIAVDIFRTLRFCGVILLHAPRMVPHALTYLTYSTFRRPHNPSVASALSIGNIASREQMRAMSQLVTKRAARALHRRKAAENQRRIARPLQANRSAKQVNHGMRILGGGSPLNLTERHWRLPGARFLGVVLVGFRS